MSSDDQTPNPFAAPTAYDTATTVQPMAPAAAAIIKSKLTPPAIIMIVIAVISMIFMVVDFGFRIYNLANPDFFPADETRRMSMMVGSTAGAVMDLANLICQVLVINGSIAMMRGRGHQKATTASIISMVPCISGCCVLNIPFGIWAFTILKQPDVVAFFESPDRAVHKD